MTDPIPTQAEVDAVARRLLATVPTKPIITATDAIRNMGQAAERAGRAMLDLGPLFEAAIRQRAAERRRQRGQR